MINSLIEDYFSLQNATLLFMCGIHKLYLGYLDQKGSPVFLNLLLITEIKRMSSSNRSCRIALDAIGKLISVLMVTETLNISLENLVC